MRRTTSRRGSLTGSSLPPDEAAELLIRLAGRSGLDAGDAAVKEIARLCGYLPLAIGMLARQLHHHPAWTAAELAADLASARDRLQLMQAENVSVAAAFDLAATVCTTPALRPTTNGLDTPSPSRWPCTASCALTATGNRL